MKLLILIIITAFFLALWFYGEARDNTSSARAAREAYVEGNWIASGPY
jgi:4-amino-4-deoxy-L-arabinose transferase-like glycosyltransferase